MSPSSSARWPRPAAATRQENRVARCPPTRRRVAAVDGPGRSGRCFRALPPPGRGQRPRLARHRARYRSQLAAWVAWCAEHNIDARTATTDDDKCYREDLVDNGRQPNTIAHKLNVLRRVYAAADAPAYAATTRPPVCVPRAIGGRPRISAFCPRSTYAALS